MRVYCGDYMNYAPPKSTVWKRAMLILLFLLLTIAATPAMISYYWDGQNSTKSLALEEAMRLSQDGRMPEMMRKNAQVEIYLHAKRAVQALHEADKSTEVLLRASSQLLGKLKDQIEENR